MHRTYEHPSTGTVAYLDQVASRHRLSYIQTPPGFRGQGGASHVLRAITADADREAVTLCLVVRADEMRQPRLGQPQLVAWYERHGFVYECETHDGPRYSRQPKREG